jgi:hypothetical protein
MPSQSVIHTKRQIARAKITAAKILEKPEGQMAALKSLVPDFLTRAAQFEAADAQVRQIDTRAQVEIQEGLRALAPLAGAYDAARAAMDAKLGTAHAGSSTCATPDDLLRIAQELREELELQEAQPWAASLLAEFEPVIDAAVKEQAEASQAMKDLQKAQLARESASGALRPVFVSLRHLIRATFGRSAREYRELLDRRAGATPEEEEQESESASNEAAAPPRPTAPSAQAAK